MEHHKNPLSSIIDYYIPLYPNKNTIISYNVAPPVISWLFAYHKPVREIMDLLAPTERYPTATGASHIVLKSHVPKHQAATLWLCQT